MAFNSYTEKKTASSILTKSKYEQVYNLPSVEVEHYIVRHSRVHEQKRTRSNKNKLEKHSQEVSKQMSKSTGKMDLI